MIRPFMKHSSFTDDLEKNLNIASWGENPIKNGGVGRKHQRTKCFFFLFAMSGCQRVQGSILSRSIYLDMIYLYIYIYIHNIQICSSCVYHYGYHWLIIIIPVISHNTSPFFHRQRAHCHVGLPEFPSKINEHPSKAANFPWRSMKFP